MTFSDPSSWAVTPQSTVMTLGFIMFCFGDLQFPCCFWVFAVVLIVFVVVVVIMVVVLLRAVQLAVCLLRGHPVNVMLVC